MMKWNLYVRLAIEQESFNVFWSFE